MNAMTTLLPSSPALRASLLRISNGYWIKISSTADKKGRFCGLHGLVSDIGEELAIKFLRRAQNAKTDKITCRLRRGVVVSFYVR